MTAFFDMIRQLCRSSGVSGRVDRRAVPDRTKCSSAYDAGTSSSFIDSTDRCGGTAGIEAGMEALWPNTTHAAEQFCAIVVCMQLMNAHSGPKDFGFLQTALN